MRVLFMGTPEFALPSLEILREAGHQVAGVVTRPDRPRGRGGKTTGTPVKRSALEAGIPVLTPERLDEEFRETVTALRPEIVVTVAYGRLLPAWLLDLPAAAAALNVHASLLPAYRGAAPIQRAIMAGENRTGVTIMYMDRGMDTGDILRQASLDILPRETAGELSGRLATLGAVQLRVALELLAAGQATRTAQAPEGVSAAPPLTGDEEEIAWDRTAEEVVRLVRALAPKPAARTRLPGGGMLKIGRAEPVEGRTDGRAPGEVLEGEGICVATGRGKVRLATVQPAGGKSMEDVAYMRGTPLRPGSILGR